MQTQNLIHYGSIFLTFGLIDQVISIHTDNRLVGRNHHDIEFVDVPELACLRFSGTGHAGQLLVHAEVVLQGDGGIRLCGSLHLHIFLCLDSLVQTVGVAAALHDTASLLIHNLHLVVDDDVFHIFVEHGEGFQQLVDSVDTVGSDSVVVIDFLLAGQLFVRSEVFLLQFGDLGTHIGHDEHLGLVGILADEINTFVHNIDRVELLFDYEIEFIIDEVHIAVLVLHEERFRALQHLFHAGLAQELDERLVLRQTAVGAEQQHGAFVLWFRIRVLGQHLLGLREDLRHVSALCLIQLLHDGLVLVEGLLVAFGRGTGNNQRGTGVVNQHGVHLIDDGVVVRALHQLADVAGHVVTQVVETEFIVGTVGDVSVVSAATVVGVGLVLVDAIHGEAEEFVEQTHPLGVTFGQVVVDGDHVDAFSRQCVQIDGQGSDEGFTLTSGHLGDFTLVEHDTADELHVIMAHVPLNHVAAGHPAVLVDGFVSVDGDAFALSGQVAVVLRGRHGDGLVLLEAAGSLLHHGEGLRQYVVEDVLRGGVDLIL